MSTLKWKKPFRERHGLVVVRETHCGRARIETREYDMPIVSKGYRVFVDGKRAFNTEWDTLADARSMAQEFAYPTTDEAE